MTPLRTRLKKTEGAALAELALVLPLLLLLLLGMLDFGKAFNAWITETHLASEGARLAAVNYCPHPGSDASGNLTCDWSPAPTSCTYANPARCLAKYIDAQTRGELSTGRLANAYAPGQNETQVCISYPNLGATKVGDPVLVTLKVQYHWLNYVTKQLSIGTTQILGSATMRLESAPLSSVPLTVASCYPDSPAGT